MARSCSARRRPAPRRIGRRVHRPAPGSDGHLADPWHRRITCCTRPKLERTTVHAGRRQRLRRQPAHRVQRQRRDADRSAPDVLGDPLVGRVEALEVSDALGGCAFDRRPETRLRADGFKRLFRQLAGESSRRHQPPQNAKIYTFLAKRCSSVKRAGGLASVAAAWLVPPELLGGRHEALRRAEAGAKSEPCADVPGREGHRAGGDAGRPGRASTSREYRPKNSLGQVPTLELDDGDDDLRDGRHLPLFRGDASRAAAVRPHAGGEGAGGHVGAPGRVPADAAGRRLLAARPPAHGRRCSISTRTSASPTARPIPTPSAGWTASWRTGARSSPARPQMADICALSTVDFAHWIGLDLDAERPHLAAWHARLNARGPAQPPRSAARRPPVKDERAAAPGSTGAPGRSGT